MITTTPSSTGSAPSSDSDLGTGLELWPEVPDVWPPPTPADRSRPGARRPGDRRLGYLAVGVALLVLMAGVAVAYVTSKVSVELSIDGQVQPIDTRADTVGDLLADQGITVGGDDLLVPALDTPLAEGQVVEIRYARPVLVTIDGVLAEHTTTELSLGGALAAIGAPVDGAAISVPLDQQLPLTGTAVEIITPKSVNLDVGGQTSSVTSTDKTVGDLLESQNIVLADADTVSPAATTVVADAMAITVTRIRVENEVRIEAIAHETVERNDPEQSAGTRSTVTAGVDGEREVTYAVTTTNGEVTSEQEVSATVTREPVTEEIRVGTKPVPAPVAAAPSGASGGLNWAALAQCESGGNPKAVNPAGYYGLYQFSMRTWASVGGSGNPADASPAEQSNRAQILYDKAGAGQWPVCGRKLFN